MSHSGIYIQNSSYIMCQIIRTQQELEEFLQIDSVRRCLIEDWVNFQAFNDASPPYNQKNIKFAIHKNLYEACTQ